MAAKKQYRHTCRPEDQGMDKSCLACTQEIYFECRARSAGADIPLSAASQFAWTDTASFEEVRAQADALTEEYSTAKAAVAFKKLGIDLLFELRVLRRLTSSRLPKNTPIVQLKALLAIQDLRREVMRGVHVGKDTPPGGNGVVEPLLKPGMAKDDWTGSG